MRAEKKSIVEHISRTLAERPMFIITDYTGLSSNQMNELRTLLKQSGSAYLVVKNRLLKRVFTEEIVKALGSGMIGPTAIAVSGTDCARLTKIIMEFAKKNDAPRVKAGFLEGNFLTAAEISVFAALPPRQVLLARLLGGMQGPLAGFVRGLGDLLRQFVVLVDQINRKKGGQNEEKQG